MQNNADAVLCFLSTFANHAESCKDIIYYHKRTVSHSVANVECGRMDSTVEVCLVFVDELWILPVGVCERSVCAVVAFLQTVGVPDFAGSDSDAVRDDTAFHTDRRHGGASGVGDTVEGGGAEGDDIQRTWIPRKD